MNSTSSSLAILTKAVAELGGPSISVNDIEWVSQVPAGNELICWLVDQCDLDDGKSLDIGTALRSIALEHDETQILKHAMNDTRINTKLGGEAHSTIHAPSGYNVPSHLKKHANYVDKDTRLLEAHSSALNSRLKQTKRASRAVEREVSSLRGAIEHQNTVITSAQERLAELSVLADTTLATGANAADTLLDTLAPNNQGESSPLITSILESSTGSLTSLAKFRTSLADNYVTCLLNHVPPPPPKGILETDLLQNIDSLLHDKRLHESAYALELRRLCDLISREESLSDSVPQPKDDGDGLDAASLFKKAWLSDQAMRLDTEHAILVSTIREHKGALLPALNALYDQLSAHEETVRASEALIGAFGIEVEGLIALVEDAARGLVPVDHSTRDGTTDETLEEQLKRLFLQSDGDNNNWTPIDIKTAILTELRHLQTSAYATAEGWNEVVHVTEKLSSQDTVHHNAMNALYDVADMQTNTTTPFRREIEVENLTQRARGVTAKLEVDISQGEELCDLLTRKKTQRKFVEFVGCYQTEGPEQ